MLGRSGHVFGCFLLQKCISQRPYFAFMADFAQEIGVIC